MAKGLKKANQPSVSSEPVPQLICIKKPTADNNNGVYKVRIPFRYMLVTEKAAFYEFNFIGMREGI